MTPENSKLGSFDNSLLISYENIEFQLRGQASIPWSDFLLNPRRLRGSDFLMRWSQGLWSEHRITQGINESKDFFALPYGTSSTAPENDIRKYELYFELLDKAGHGDIKRPDLLIFRKSDKPFIYKLIKSIEKNHKIPFILNTDAKGHEHLKGEEIFPFIHEGDKDLKALLSKAIIAVESENSLWKAKMMPNYKTPMKPMRRLGNQPGLSKGSVLPTVIIKEEDRVPLLQWQKNNKIDIHVWHVFFDLAYGLPLNRAEEIIKLGLIEANIQRFQAPNGTTTEKAIYKFYYHYAYELGESVNEPTLKAACITDKNGHIMPYVSFEGGNLRISKIALDILTSLAKAK